MSSNSTIPRMRCGSELCEIGFKCCTRVQGHLVAYSSYCCHPDHYNLMMIICFAGFGVIVLGFCICLGWARIKNRRNKQNREKDVRSDEDDLPKYDEIHTKSTSLPGYQHSNLPSYQQSNLPAYENNAYSSTEII